MYITERVVCEILFSVDQSNYKTLFGVLDNCFLVAYAIGMFFRYVVVFFNLLFASLWVTVRTVPRVDSGIFGERLPLRYYLSFGMLTSGLFTCLFGLGYYWEIHSLLFYAFIQVEMQHSKHVAPHCAFVPAFASHTEKITMLQLFKQPTLQNQTCFGHSDHMTRPKSSKIKYHHWNS